MSEFLQNREYKQEILKKLIRDLHSGQDPQKVKENFRELIKDLSAAEISMMEEQLIAEGLPREEVRELCDVHVEIFREALDRNKDPESIPGHPVYTLRHENREAESILNHLDRLFSEMKSSEQNKALASYITLLKDKLLELKEIEKHYLKKENILFPYLERHNITGPPSVMWSVDDQIRAGLKNLIEKAENWEKDLQAFSIEEVERQYNEVKKQISDMFYKEEKILVPMLLDILSNQEWAEIKIQDEEFGPVFSPPPKGPWAPDLKEEAKETPVPSPVQQAADQKLPLQTGYLTLEQVNLMLKHLPIDVTFVDENDTVQYFSKGKERIFTRTDAIIGRKVQNCHPPASVHVVEKILTDFKTGKHDTAEFWIQMKGMFIHIRYFAVRDEQGRYKGTLEVSQDITNIRKLEGERRLLHYDD